jgi:hypothetical protein
MRREEVAEGTMAFHFEKPSGFSFRAGQFADVTFPDPVETDAKGNTRTFSIASPPFANELVFDQHEVGYSIKITYFHPISIDFHKRRDLFWDRRATSITYIN